MPDWTVFVQLGIFLSTLAVLNFFVFGPVLRTLDRRRKFTEERRAEAERINAEAETLERHTAVRLSVELEKIAKENDLKMASANREAEKIVRAARVEAKKISDTADASIAFSEEQVADEIKKGAEELADDIVHRVIN